MEDRLPATSPAPAAWRCAVCGYIHEGPEPPAECPLCAAPSSSFEPHQASAATPTADAPGSCIVILGAGIAGVSAAESARKTSPRSRIVLLSTEKDLPYYRLNLTRFLAGEVAEADLAIHPADWYTKNDIELRLGTEAASILPPDRVVARAGGETVPFDRLIIAAGAHAFLPPLPGSGMKGVYTLRHLDDARALAGAVQPGLRCVCVGGGLLGLETAGALVRRGAEVTLLESHSSLMPRQLNARAGDILGRYAEGLGLRLRKQARTKEIAGGDRVRHVVLEDGSRLDADLVVVATGVRSNTHLARAAGLHVQQGIVVDDSLLSSQAGVHAAGDVAEHRGVLYGSWQAAQSQGAIAGINAAGGRAEFRGIPRSHTLKVLGLGMTSIGQFEPLDGSYRVVDEATGSEYRRFVFHDGRLAGAVLLGNTRLASACSRAIEEHRDFSALLAGRLEVRTVEDQLA